MADRSHGEIWIGGKIKRELVPELCKAICAEHVWLPWSGDEFQPQSEEDLLMGVDDSYALCLTISSRSCPITTQRKLRSFDWRSMLNQLPALCGTAYYEL